MTANQLVAFNLKKAREEKGWTQEQAAQALYPYLGKKWPKASFSIAERSADEGARKRNFNANELLAFSQAFGKSVGWFFDAPPGEPVDIYCSDKPGTAWKPVSSAQLGQAVYGADRALTERQLRKIEAAVGVIRTGEQIRNAEREET